MAKRKQRGNGEGSIYEHKRDGRKVGYRGAYTVYTASGPKRRYVSGKTREEARLKLTKAMADRDGGLVFEDGGLTVGDYVERWLKDSVRGTVRQSTYEAYEYMTYPHIVPSLGRVKLKALTPVHVRTFYREKLDGGLSSATVRKMHGVLQKALDQAVSDGLIPRNAAKGIRLPQGKKKEIRPLSPDEARALLDAARGDRLETLYVLAISTGLREGELLARHGLVDVDLEAAVLRVSRTLTRNGGKVSIGPPKTKNSRRTVAG
jgi:integrase